MENLEDRLRDVEWKIEIRNLDSEGLNICKDYTVSRTIGNSSITAKDHNNLQQYNTVYIWKHTK